MNPWFETTIETRSYEIDAFGHLNHAVYLNYFEVARIQLLEDAGYPVQELLERGWGVHVVRVEVDYRRELFRGQELEITTRVADARNSSMTLHQVAADAADPATVFAEARVVAVWIGAEGRPVRIPDDVRAGLGVD